jgi:hypothetical protein
MSLSNWGNYTSSLISGVAPERTPRIGLVDAWRFLNESAALLKLCWAL